MGRPLASRQGDADPRHQLRPRGRPGTDDHQDPPAGRLGRGSPGGESGRPARRGPAAGARARSPRGTGAAHQVMIATSRPPLSFWQIWNMCFGFLGIQFGWALQMANMSSIYEYLGADAHQIPILWLAAPLTGLFVQPIIGHMSDRTWNRLGRRRPYFLVGALFASFALIAMPSSGTLWMAAGLLWVMDASINISMEPFRAFVADLLPPEQRTRGYAMQALFIGLGAVVASMLPWLLYDLFPPGRDGGTLGKAIPFAVRLAFYAGAFAFLAAVLWTVFTTREHPPDDLEAFREAKGEKARIGAAVSEIFHAVLASPPTMRG